ncbi:zinc finger protein 524 isoform X3 [Peromyscus maniculatus bairdii]|uniref:Zinc finger protein 524 n=2 Tax=Peromyscus maniculatus bairdii TaxID=230844 RepID=A0A6I9M2V3_PERMB|nr:zinc finger protein 524 isoform X2 [Peromyscus maniculatus bairdii]XP_042126825.1 zinc finger protein 524 isoform X2 [Peromyscus maniculatus bairdii]
MDNPSSDPLPSALSGEEEKPLALLPPVPRGRRGRPPGGAATSHRTLKSSLPRKRGRPPKSLQEAPLTAPVDSGGSHDLLLIDDQGVPYTVPEGSAADGPQGSGPKRAPHFCPVCLRAFPYLSDLERHSISHSELKPHVCKDCGKTFKRSSHLRRHCNIHAGHRPFRCVLCPRRFREAGELAHHHRIHSGERPYQCPSCRVRFTEANTLRRHYKRKHPELVGMPVRLCPANPRPQPLWDADEGVPVPERVQEESPEGKEPAWPPSSTASPLSGFTEGSPDGAGQGQGGQDTLVSGGTPVTEGGQKQGPKPLGPDTTEHPPSD